MNVCNFKLTRQIQANTTYCIFKMFTLVTSLPGYGQGKERTRSDGNILLGSHGRCTLCAAVSRPFLGHSARYLGLSQGLLHLHTMP